jgi:hypothetical protein
MNKKIKAMVKEYNLDMEFTYFGEEESYEYEDVIIPIRLYLEDYPEALDEIVEADKKLVKGYEKLKDGSYLKKILTPIYKLAKKNVEAHLEVA